MNELLGHRQSFSYYISSGTLPSSLPSSLLKLANLKFILRNNHSANLPMNLHSRVRVSSIDLGVLLLLNEV
jgi:hypothetical protein